MAAQLVPRANGYGFYVRAHRGGDVSPRLAPRHAAAGFDRAAWPTHDVSCALCGPGPVHVVRDTDRYGWPVRTVQCDGCGLRFISPRMTADGYAAFYQHGYRPLLETLRGGRRQSLDEMEHEQRAYARELAETVAPWVAPYAGGTLLDVGGSTGVVGRHFRDRWGFAVTVIDPAPDELARAVGCQTICGSAETVDLPAVDVALVCRAIEHCLDPLAVLRRLRARRLVVDAMNVEAWPEPWRYKVDHPYAFTAETFERLVTAAGWTVRDRWTRRGGKYKGLVCSPQE